MGVFSRLLVWGFSLAVLGVIGVAAVIVWALYAYGRDLPDYRQLANYEPPIVTRVYAGDGALMAEFATEKRTFVPINAIPDQVKQAFLSAEDKHFYYHPGLDFIGIARAVVVNVKNMNKGRRMVGASTITQQVAKNFLLTNEVSYERKIKEAILAFRIERTYSKEKILELYLNEIYLGMGNYGVAAAALNYFNKSLNELSVEEAAYLAALPKAPNNYHPIHKYQAALTRRNWVIKRMTEDGHISKEEAERATLTALETVTNLDRNFVRAPYFAEEVRRILMEKYGENSLYQGGLLVHATVDAQMQKIAQKVLRDGLVDYDRRKGATKKVIAHFDDLTNWKEQLAKVAKPVGAGAWKLATVLETGSKKATIGFKDGAQGVVTYNKAKWARIRLKNGEMGQTPSHVYQVLKKGDVILTEPSGEKLKDVDIYHYRQIPEVQGAIVAMDPYTGRVLAMAGGFSQASSEFNRATQAMRQPGSSFKPLVYLTALENGFTPATLILDAPFVIDQGPGLPKWRPSNYSGEFYGPTPLRVGIEKSRNLMTVRLANYVGMDKIAEMSKRFGLHENLQPVLSMSIGAGETTLLKVVSSYAVFANGGKKITPSFIDRIQNRHGKTVFRHDQRACEGCGPLIAWEEAMATPEVPDTRPEIVDPKHAYQITSILEGAIQRGTGVRLRSLGRPLAGKTGTTNDSKDTWFVGYTPNIVVGAYVGYDTPRPMGKKETGSRVSAPIVKAFFEEALKDIPPTPFRVPEGIRMVQVNAEDGTRARIGDEKVIWEAFIAGTEPTDQAVVFDGEEIKNVSDTQSASGEGASVGTGGIY